MINKFISSLVSQLSPKLFFAIAYIHNRGHIPNFDNPKDLSEIWISKVLAGEINHRYYLADKYAVRDYVTNKGLSHLLTPLIGVYDDVSEIDFEKLPTKFALKMNFLAGMNIICTDKSKLDILKTKITLGKWLTKRTLCHSERHYNLIKPCIICEEFIDDGSGHFPTDYKFMCINGKVSCILACTQRDIHTHYSPYSIDWKPLNNFKKNGTCDIIEKPKNLDEMISIAEILSQGIDLVRVDLYSSGERIWFGEMTLTPAGCIFHGWTQEALNTMGKQYLKHKIE